MNEAYRITNRLLLTTIFPIALICACGNGAQAPEPVTPSTDPGRPTAEPAPAPQNPAAPIIPQSAAPKMRTIYDFAARLGQAHIRSGGLLIDFGTAARDKYTLGEWKTGWRGNYEIDGTTFTYLSGSAGRIFVSLRPEEAGGGKIVLRAKGIGATKGRIYLNNESVGTVSFPDDSYGHAEVSFSKGLKAGANEILVRADGQKRAHDHYSAALAIDFVRIIPGDADDSQASSGIDAFTALDPRGGKAGISLREGESLTWNLPVTEEMFVSGIARRTGEGDNASIEITATGDDGKTVSLGTVEGSASGAEFALPVSIPAASVAALSFGGKVGELTLDNLRLQAPLIQAVRAPGERSARNVLVVVIDTLRADHLDIYNTDTRVQTPFLSEFAKSGIVFERPLSQENWTKPSTATILSGLHPSTHQTKTERNMVPSSVTLMSEHFKQLGWATAGFVANGYVSGKFGFEQGWDQWTNYVREGKANRAQFVAEDVINWLKKRPADKSFFMYIHTIDPHVPYMPPQKYRAMYDNEPYNGVVEASETAKLLERVKGGLKLSERDKIRLEALYDGEISYHDEHFASIYKELEVEGLLDNTVIVVTSDHGEEFYDHGSVGHGHSMYQELLRVPFLIRLPGAAPEKIPARSGADVGTVDIMPTMCALTGTTCPAEVEGRSLLPLLNGEPYLDYPDRAFSEFLESQRVVRMGRYKLILRGFRTTVFDLEKDVRETEDLSEQLPVTFNALMDLLGQHLGRFRHGAGKSDSAGKGDKPAHKATDADIDPETRKQLEALGYMGH